MPEISDEMVPEDADTFPLRRESVLRALNEDSPCADLLQRLATARGGINSLMAELMEGHLRNHMPATSKPLEDAADDLIEIVRTYLK
jgi:DNA-binding FrmR family transcriptional regulator